MTNCIECACSHTNIFELTTYLLSDSHKVTKVRMCFRLQIAGEQKCVFPVDEFDELNEHLSNSLRTIVQGEGKSVQ
jgi:hypothetical protein